jgi:putative ABC transport system substrate-binding protein
MPVASRSYGANSRDMFRQVADQIAKIFDGTAPADLPMEQASRFELVINLKTAKTFSGSCQASFS